MEEKSRRSIKDYAPAADAGALEADEIIRLARMARIVDERDGLPLFRKLKAAQDKDAVLLVEAMDDEPYISSQLGPLLHLREECASGAALARRAVGAKDVLVLVYKNITDLEIKIPKTIEGLEVQRIGGVYPADNRSESSLPRRKNASYLYVGACALIHLHRAVFQGTVQTTAFVTVAGDCVDKPANLEVSLGLSATRVLEACGLIVQPNRVIAGGSMTGVSIADTDKVTVTPVTRALLAFREDQRDRRYACIGCGRCTEVCPMGLDPRFICACLDMNRRGELRKTDYQYCVGCMSCSYSCPAKLDLAARVFGLSHKGEVEG